MRKSTVFISAVLTTFALAMLYGVVLAYRNISSVSQLAAQPMPTFTAEPTDVPVATQTIITPEQAAQLAAQVVGKTNLLSAESSSINGVDAFKIMFTNNDVVYVSLDGQILSVQVAPVVVNVAAPVPARQKDRNKDKTSNDNNSNTESHVDDDDEHDD